uniref:Uncharacterized protein n=1 Tax=Paraburkholderia sprentiae WSM5005 TaxID=754502 RepID=A0A1I9YEJ7_9BURK
MRNGSDDHVFVIAVVVFLGYASGAANTAIRPFQAVAKVSAAQFELSASEPRLISFAFPLRFG